MTFVIIAAITDRRGRIVAKERRTILHPEYKLCVDGPERLRIEGYKKRRLSLFIHKKARTRAKRKCLKNRQFRSHLCLLDRKEGLTLPAIWSMMTTSSDRNMKISGLILVMFFPATSWAGLFEFNGTSLPEDSGWERTPISDINPFRLLENGWFIQEFQIVGDADFYRRPLTEFVGMPYFFVEWRVETNALASLLDTTQTPVNLTIGANGPSLYHTTITDSRVQLLRDTNNPLVFVDVEPNVPHTYRIELFGDELYRWLIDGQVVDSGVPEGAFPNANSFIVWGTRNYEPGITTHWDYIRYGTIPEPATLTFLIVGASQLVQRRNPRVSRPRRALRNLEL